MPNQISGERAAAIANGETTYFTGKSCKHGHVSPRNVADSSCVACRAVWRNSNRAYINTSAKEKRARLLADDPIGVREKWAAEQRTIRERDPERVRDRDRKNSKLKRQRHPKVKLADTRKRQAAKIQRTPGWADLKAIREFYENCPPGCHVDHIIPLRGKLVSGLHVENNLQYLPAKDNLCKGSTYDLGI